MYNAVLTYTIIFVLDNLDIYLFLMNNAVLFLVYEL